MDVLKYALLAMLIAAAPAFAQAPQQPPASQASQFTASMSQYLVQALNENDALRAQNTDLVKQLEALKAAKPAAAAGGAN